jgi:hypothetical protein
LKDEGDDEKDETDRATCSETRTRHK